MSRVKRGVQSSKKHKSVLKDSKGFRGARSRVFRVAKQAVIKSSLYSYIDRKKKKRNFRSLWIVKINAACREYNISYSHFIFLLKKNSINLNRKIMADLVFDKVFFSSLVKVLI